MIKIKMCMIVIAKTACNNCEENAELISARIFFRQEFSEFFQRDTELVFVNESYENRQKITLDEKDCYFPPVQT